MTPSLSRRMACFVYEALLLFGISLVPGLIGAALSTHDSFRQTPVVETALRIVAFLVYGAYFIGFWSVRGQTLPMQTWHIRLERSSGAPIDWRRAACRYLACWIWIAPPALLATRLHWTPWQSLGTVAAWIVVYAALARLQPHRQFWHDAACDTRLVDYRPAKPG